VRPVQVTPHLNRPSLAAVRQEARIRTKGREACLHIGQVIPNEAALVIQQLDPLPFK